MQTVQTVLAEHRFSEQLQASLLLLFDLPVFILRIQSRQRIMNSMNAPSGPASLWQEARNKADGRVYYYNVQTQATQWQKPVELMAPVEVCTFASLSSVFLAHN